MRTLFENAVLVAVVGILIAEFTRPDPVRERDARFEEFFAAHSMRYLTSISTYGNLPSDYPKYGGLQK